MNIKRFSKIIFNFNIIIITLFILTTIVKAEDSQALTNTDTTNLNNQITLNTKSTNPDIKITEKSNNQKTEKTQSTNSPIIESKLETESTQIQSEKIINNDINETIKEDKIIKTQSTQEAISTQANTKKNYQYVRFFINYKSEALDSEGNVGAQDPDKFTPQLWECDVKNATANTNYHIAGESADNSYEADKKIRKLVGDKKDGSIYITSFPTDEYIFKELKQYVNTLSVEGKNIKVEELNTEHYEVRWYVFKLHSNFWHIDGKLVRKEGQIIVTKTFKGNKDGIEELTGYSFEKNKQISKSNFNITLKGGTDVKVLNLENYTNIENNSTDNEYILTYKWNVKTKYGITYSIKENNYNLQYYTTSCSYNIKDPKITTDTYKNQSKEEILGDEASILGYNNYADDSEELLEESQMLKVNFTNKLTPIDSYTIMPETGGDGNFKICLTGIFLIGTSLILFNKKNQKFFLCIRKEH